MSNRIKEVGKHDYSGEYEPGKSRHRSQTFSVGVFEWLQKSDRKGLKRGAAKVRIIGSSCYPDAVYAEAERCCDLLDAGQELGFKTKRVWE